MKDFNLEDYELEDGLLVYAEITIDEESYKVTKTDEPGIISTSDGYKAVYNVENVGSLSNAQVKLPLETSEGQLDPESVVDRILGRSRFNFSETSELDELLDY
ncbi:MAG: hypothetical protein ACI9LV_000317 [Candidatus Nanohaloarchaea archaeon]|jgi:hypothetical protein